MSADRKPPQSNKKSPLYTQKAVAALKAADIRKWGRDSDGAYRHANRLDDLN